MTSKHHGRQHLRLINSPSESGAYRREDAGDAAMSVLMTPTTEDLAPGRPHLFAVRQLEQDHEAPEEPDFTQSSVEGSLSDVMSAPEQTPEQGAHTVQETRENFQESDFWAARRRRAAEKAGQTLGVAYGPSDPADTGADAPTQQFPPIPHWPDDAS